MGNNYLGTLIILPFTLPLNVTVRENTLLLCHGVLKIKELHL